MLAWSAAERPQCILQTLGQRDKACRATINVRRQRQSG
jgi:hypothetical protein